MLSGRYRSDYLCRHWSDNNKNGWCLLCPDKQLIGDLDHSLWDCEALSEKRNLLIVHMLTQTSSNPNLHNYIQDILASKQEFIQF